MSTLGVVSFGDAPAAETLAALGAHDVVLARDCATAQELADAAGASRRTVLWLPAWAAPSVDLIASACAWRTRVAGDGAAVALAAPRLVCADGSALLAPRVLLSTAGAVTLAGDAPSAVPGARSETLASALDVRLPGDLQAHLEEINRQTSVAARLRHAAGRAPAWRDLTWTPLALALRGLLAVSGSRRAVLPRLVLEAYREVLVTAKLWELAHPAAAA